MICPRRHPGCLRRGAAAAELAIILPVLVMVVLSCVDFGFFPYNYIALGNAVRAGAAYEMMLNPASLPAGWQSQVKQAVSNEMSLQPGFVPANLTVTAPPPTIDAGGIYQFTVTAAYPFQTVISYVGIPHSLTLAQTVTMRFIRP
jgi:Flp pilus assembly protein TadG